MKHVVLPMLCFLLACCYLLSVLQYVQLLHLVAGSISVVFAACSLYVLCVALWLYDCITGL
jgi:hypothetical protein